PSEIRKFPSVRSALGAGQRLSRSKAPRRTVGPNYRRRKHRQLFIANFTGVRDMFYLTRGRTRRNKRRHSRTKRHSQSSSALPAQPSGYIVRLRHSSRRTDRFLAFCTASIVGLTVHYSEAWVFPTVESAWSAVTRGIGSRLPNFEVHVDAVVPARSGR